MKNGVFKRKQNNCGASFFIMFTFLLTACGTQNGTAQKKDTPAGNNNFNTPSSMITTKLLEKQISLGGNPSDWGFNAANQEDLNLSLSLQDSILEKNGYQKSADFAQKAEAIFHLKSSRWQNDPVQLEIGFDENINYTQCYESSDGLRLALAQQSTHVFISAQHQLVGNLYLVPQLIDYQKQFPQAQKFEQTGAFRTASSKAVQKWEDIPGLAQQRNTIVQTIIARNKYLFNNDRSQLRYLLINDSVFMNALVEIFGYSKDENLLRAVLQKYNSAATDFETSPNKLGRIIFPKDCSKKLEVRKDMLDYISGNTAQDDVRLMFALGVFASNLIIAEDETLNQVYSKEDKRKIVAHIAAIYDPAFKLYRETNNANWPKVPLLAFLFRRDPGAEQALKQQKNYNIPHLQEWIDFSTENFSDDFLYK